MAARPSIKAVKEKKKPEKNGCKSAKSSSDLDTRVKRLKQPEESKAVPVISNEGAKRDTKKKQNAKINATLMHTQPKNIEEQKQMFFRSNCSINPIFEYTNYAAAQQFMSYYREPSDELFELSKRILNSFIEIYGSETNYLETEGDIVGREETFTIFSDYIKALGFERLISIHFRTNQVAPTSVTVEPRTGKNCVNIKDPPEYRQGRI